MHGIATGERWWWIVRDRLYVTVNMRKETVREREERVGDDFT